MSTNTTTALGRKNRSQTTTVPQGLGRVLLAVVALLLVGTLAVSAVPGLLLAAGLALWAGLLVAVVAAPFALVVAVAESA